MNSYGPIQKVLVRGSVFDLEDRVASYKAIADAERSAFDVSAIDRDVVLLENDLQRLRMLLAR